MLKIIFFISGVAGLIYQTIWVREFGHIFGNTFQSASIVMGVFVFNLGLGSYLGGYLIDKYHNREPRVGLAAYIGAEIIIAAFGLLLAFVIPLLEPLSAFMSSYEVAANGWHELSSFSYFSRYFIATALLMVPTLCMGATLTFLIRFVLENNIDEAGLHTGILYGANTLGAAVGCFFVDTIGIAYFGLMSTKLIAVLLNVLAVFFSLALLKKQSPGVPLNLKPEHNNESLVNNLFKDLSPTHIGIAIFVSGFAAMGLEIIWFRFLASLLSSTRETFSFLLGIILIGIWLGANVGGRLTLKKMNPGWVFIIGQLGLALSALVLLFAFTRLSYIGITSYILIHQAGLEDFGFYLANIAKFWPILFIVALPAFFMGFAFPAANAALHSDPDKVGVTTGHIYIWNSTGSLLGSLAAGFILLPAIGSQNSFLVLASISLIAIIPIALYIHRSEKFKLKPSFAAAVALSLAVLYYWTLQPSSLLLTSSFREDPRGKNGIVLAKKEGINESIVVTEHKGDALGRSYKRLSTNGHSMSATTYESQRYMRSFSHIPLLQIEHPTDVLVICFGVGNTAHSASLHPSIKNIEIADISKNVLNHAHHFADTNHNIIKDPRTKVFINDGRQHLRMKPENSYDLVTLEPPPLTHAGVASLYGVEFYKLAHRALKSGGYVSQWWPAYQLNSDNSKSLIAAFVEVFPNAVLLHGAEREFILLGQKDGENKIDFSMVVKSLNQRPKVMADLNHIKMGSIEDILGTFVSGPTQLKKAVEYFEPIRDDYPIMEYQGALFRGYLAPEFFNTLSFKEWCPSCFKNNVISDELADMPNYLALKQSVFWSSKFSIILLDDKAKNEIEWPGIKVPIDAAKPLSEKYDHLKIFLSRYSD